MAENVAEFLLERLSQWGVSRIRGYPGDGINGIWGRIGASLWRATTEFYASARRIVRRTVSVVRP